MLKRIGVLALAGLIGAACLALNERALNTGTSTALISPAQAVVGRPLTPVSVAGAARRTARRCAAGVYYC